MTNDISQANIEYLYGFFTTNPTHKTLDECTFTRGKYNKSVLGRLKDVYGFSERGSNGSLTIGCNQLFDIFNNTSQNRTKHYYRGCFEGSEEAVSTYLNDKTIKLVNTSGITLLEYTDIVNVNDFLYEIYSECKVGAQLLFDFGIKFEVALANTELRGGFVFKWKRLVPEAVAPYKAFRSDSGYDLTLISLVKKVGDVSFFTTGIAVEPPVGYYFDLVGRSSISKTGYSVANCVGIIDHGYRGPIIVALRKHDQLSADLPLPCRLVQLIPRKVIPMVPIECESLGSTLRDYGGFGSSG